MTTKKIRTLAAGGCIRAFFPNTAKAGNGQTLLGSISLLQEVGIWSRERRQEVATVTSYHESTVTYVAPTIRLEAILC